jgi:hypothetical protein
MKQIIPVILFNILISICNGSTAEEINQKSVNGNYIIFAIILLECSPIIFIVLTVPHMHPPPEETSNRSKRSVVNADGIDIEKTAHYWNVEAQMKLR